MCKISVIIRAFNEEKHIKKLLIGIARQTLDSEVILVDSGSTDSTVDIAESMGAKVINIKPEDFSFGYALNVGCKIANGDFLVFASAHVYPVYTDWLAQLIGPFEKDKVALVYGKQRGNSSTKYSEQQIFKKWFPEESDVRQQHPFCNNANVAIRKEIWEKLPYNELLTGLEDLEWAKRAMELGYYVSYNSNATIIHVHEETYKKVLNRYRREAIAIKAIIPKQRFSIITFLRLFIVNFINDWIQATQEKVWRKNALDIIVFRYMQFWGTYLGYRDKPADKSLRRRFYYPNTTFKRNNQNSVNQQQIDYASLLDEK